MFAGSGLVFFGSWLQKLELFHFEYFFKFIKNGLVLSQKLQLKMQSAWEKLFKGPLLVKLMAYFDK